VGIARLGNAVYVVDGGNHRGQAFRSDGTWVSPFGLGRSYTRPRSEAEVRGLPGARAGADRPAAAPPSASPAAPNFSPADVRSIPESVAERLWWSSTSGDAAGTVPAVRSNGGTFWIRSRLLPESVPEGASTPPLRRPFTLLIEAFEDAACTRPYVADAALIDSWMPHHRHGMNVAPRVAAEGPGRWRAEGMLMHMSGLWEVDVDLVRQGRSERAQWNVELP